MTKVFFLIFSKKGNFALTEGNVLYFSLLKKQKYDVYCTLELTEETVNSLF